MERAHDVQRLAVLRVGAALKVLQRLDHVRVRPVVGREMPLAQPHRRRGVAGRGQGGFGAEVAAGVAAAVDLVMHLGEGATEGRAARAKHS